MKEVAVAKTESRSQTRTEDKKGVYRPKGKIFVREPRVLSGVIFEFVHPGPVFPKHIVVVLV